MVLDYGSAGDILKASPVVAVVAVVAVVVAVVVAGFLVGTAVTPRRRAGAVADAVVEGFLQPQCVRQTEERGILGAPVYYPETDDDDEEEDEDGKDESDVKPEYDESGVPIFISEKRTVEPTEFEDALAAHLDEIRDRFGKDPGPVYLLSMYEYKERQVSWRLALPSVTRGGELVSAEKNEPALVQMHLWLFRTSLSPHHVSPEEVTKSSLKACGAVAGAAGALPSSGPLRRRRRPNSEEPEKSPSRPWSGKLQCGRVIGGKKFRKKTGREIRNKLGNNMAETKELWAIQRILGPPLRIDTLPLGHVMTHLHHKIVAGQYSFRVHPERGLQLCRAKSPEKLFSDARHAARVDITDRDYTVRWEFPGRRVPGYRYATKLIPEGLGIYLIEATSLSAAVENSGKLLGIIRYPGGAQQKPTGLLPALRLTRLGYLEWTGLRYEYTPTSDADSPEVPNDAWWTRLRWPGWGAWAARALDDNDGRAAAMASSPSSSSPSMTVGGLNARTRVARRAEIAREEAPARAARAAQLSGFGFLF